MSHVLTLDADDFLEVGCLACFEMVCTCSSLIWPAEPNTLLSIYLSIYLSISMGIARVFALNQELGIRDEQLSQREYLAVLLETSDGS